LIVDVGCGSGRLAHQLAPHKDIRYIGTDVVPRLVEGAKALTMRDDWEFSVVADVHIPCADNVADFVAFFSVLTHTTHEESFKYIREAARSLKVGGQVDMSFLEFRIPCHWEMFMASINTQAGGAWNQFVDRDAISAWAAHSGLVVESFFDGDKGHIPIPEEIRWENGMCMKSLGSWANRSRFCGRGDALLLARSIQIFGIVFFNGQDPRWLHSQDGCATVVDR